MKGKQSYKTKQTRVPYIFLELDIDLDASHKHNAAGGGKLLDHIQYGSIYIKLKNM